MLLLPYKNLLAREWTLNVRSRSVSNMLSKLQGQPESYDRKFVTSSTPVLFFHGKL